MEEDRFAEWVLWVNLLKKTDENRVRSFWIILGFFGS